MKHTLLWLILAVVLVVGFVFYHSRSGGGLNVTPDASREIEKAKRR